MSDEPAFSLALPFTESTCVSCGSLGWVGVCPECGGTRPDNAESDPLLQMRRRALAGADKRVRALTARTEITTEGHVPCTSWQYGRVLADSDLLGRTQHTLAVLRQLHDLDLHDSRTVGTTVRRCVLQLVDHAEVVVEVLRDLTWFVPPERCGELRTMVEALTQWSVALAGATVMALVSGQVEALRIVAEFRNYGDAPVDLDRFVDLSVTLQTEPDSLDGRVGTALGAAGVYSDEYGHLDFARVMAADSGSAEPLLEVGKRAARYLSHVIHDPLAMGSEAAVLALPASTLASLDRPLVGHRVAFELSDLLWRAHVKDEPGTRALVERTLDDSPRLLASVARAETAQRRIALDVEATPADAVADVVEFYATTAEAGFRNYSWLMLGLQRLAAGDEVSSREAMPMLGELAQRLAASSSELAGLLTQALSPELRNAAKHEGYAIDAGGTSVDMREGKLDAGKVQLLAETMAACVAGMDAAIVAWGLESGLLLGATLPLDDSAGADFARRVITRSLLQVAGGELVSVSWGSTVTLVSQIRRPLVRANLLSVLAGISELWPEAEKLELRDDNGSLIVAALRKSFARYGDAGPETRAIAALYGVFDAAVSAGEDSEAAAQDAVAIMIRFLTPEEMEDAEPDSNEARLRILAARASATRAFIRVHSLGPSGLDERFSALLRRAETAAAAASRGDQGAFSRLLKALMPLFEWTTQRNAEFNGLFRPW